MASKFPVYLHKALEELSKGNKMRLRKETHYEAINRELQWIKGANLYRLDFNFGVIDTNITVTLYIEEYPPIFSKILIWWNRCNRLFPYRAKIKWSKLADWPIDLSKEEYKEKIIEIGEKGTGKRGKGSGKGSVGKGVNSLLKGSKQETGSDSKTKNYK